MSKKEINISDSLSLSGNLSNSKRIQSLLLSVDYLYFSLGLLREDLLKGRDYIESLAGYFKADLYFKEKISKAGVDMYKVINIFNAMEN